jgi:hypothetical protein
MLPLRIRQAGRRLEREVGRVLQEWGRPELAAGEHDLDDPAVIAWYRLEVYGPLPGQPGERDYFVMEIRACRNRHRAAVYWDPVQSRYSNLAVTQLRTQR